MLTMLITVHYCTKLHTVFAALPTVGLNNSNTTKAVCWFNFVLVHRSI